MTEGGSSNFAFLEAADDRLFRLATLAERYVFDDAPAALTKLRSFAEAMAKEIAATHALLPNSNGLLLRAKPPAFNRMPGSSDQQVAQLLMRS